MELFTLNPLFQKQAVIDNFHSVIWTERFSASGDVVFVLPPTPENISELAEGTFLSLVGTDEVMLIDSSLVQNGVLKVTGNTLSDILKNRFFWVTGGVYSGAGTPDYPTEIINRVIWWVVGDRDLALEPTTYELTDMEYTTAEFMKQRITGLTLGYSDYSGATVDWIYENGDIYDIITKYAEQYNVGFSLYLDSVDPSANTYHLVFQSYYGRDLTRDQTVNSPVIFSSALDSLTGVSRLQSIAGFKTVVLTFAEDHSWSEVTYAPGMNAAINFERREHMMTVEGASIDALGSAPAVQALLIKTAKDFLANNNYVRLLDGEIVPQSQYKFGVDYKLGDIVELDDDTDIVQKARITEYIRSQDQDGERAYPTVSVIP